MEVKKDFNERLKKFLDQEFKGAYYQSVIVVTDGKFVKGEGIRTSTVFTSNANPVKEPFIVVHDLMQALEYSVLNLIKKLYGGVIKKPEKKEPRELPGTGIYR